MAKIPLSEGFTLVPEGTHVFKITKVTYKEDFGKMEVTMVTKDKKSHTERFSLLKSDGEVNQGAMNAFSYFARVALGDPNIEEIDEQDLVGCYIRAEVIHNSQPSKNNPNKTVTFANLGDKIHADGFDDDGEEEPAPTPAPTKKEKAAPAAAAKTEKKKSGFDLNALLG